MITGPSPKIYEVWDILRPEQPLQPSAARF
jgi:hypothetical protein